MTCDNRDDDSGILSEGHTDRRIRQMRWRCRRGILEVELILQPYFERRAETLTSDRLAILEQLLACEDTDLMHWFMQGGQPENASLAALVQEILSERNG